MSVVESRRKERVSATRIAPGPRCRVATSSTLVMQPIRARALALAALLPDEKQGLVAGIHQRMNCFGVHGGRTGNPGGDKLRDRDGKIASERYQDDQRRALAMDVPSFAARVLPSAEGHRPLDCVESLVNRAWQRLERRGTAPASCTACGQAPHWILLGDRLTVGQRTLTPPVLVRIQVPQPIGIKALFFVFYSEQQA